ncbi:hypothetical protein KIN20_009589 [Parelaphostrongylus tenuis]|uniref:Uncharacterized protein n=1 Tax=Parelaphostrongylus tenuis TaxID=148309 RepID=A0AAD5MSQ6_PARTN|nr:hypothetical protein KIN20_009589 [Parelaphostrongylus tenuis]
MPISSSDRHHSVNAAIDNYFRETNEDTIIQKAGRSEVETAENIERELMGLSSMVALSVDQKSNEAPIMGEVTTSSLRHEWMKSPSIKKNVYSVRDTSEFITELPLEYYSGIYSTTIFCFTIAWVALNYFSAFRRECSL